MAADVKKPAVGSTIVELLRMPLEAAQDLQETLVPDFQRQFKDLPDIIKQNVRFGVDQFKQLPQQFRQGMKTDTADLPMLMTKAASPVPILSPAEIQDRLIEAQRTATKVGSAPPNVIDLNKILENRTKAFAEEVAKRNTEKK